jgi:hypothetical protein
MPVHTLMQARNRVLTLITSTLNYRFFEHDTVFYLKPKELTSGFPPGFTSTLEIISEGIREVFRNQNDSIKRLLSFLHFFLPKLFNVGL